ncbi:MAG: hypothetical protein ACRENA_06570 [Vulcanimicrobiaceae bacterium]
MNEKPHVMMAFACETVSAEPGKPISFENMLDGIDAEQFPAPTGRWFAVFCFYSREAGAIGNCRVIVEHEKGDIVAQNSVKDLRFGEQQPISRNVVVFQHFAWPYPGWYQVRFLAGRDTELAVFPMLIQHVEAEEADEEPEEEPEE